MKMKVDLGLADDPAADLAGKLPQRLTLIEDGRQNDEKKQREKEGPADYDEAITACGYGKFNYLLLFALVPASCAQVFATGTMSFVLPSAECDLNLTYYHKGALNAGTYAGITISAFFWGFVLDIFGRRKLIIAGFLLDFTFNCLAAFAHKFWLLLLLKICVGLSIPGPNAAVFTYIAETHSSIHTSKIIMITGGFFALAQAIQPTMAYLLIPLDFRFTLVPGVLDFTSWRLFILICAMPSLISALLFVFYPESPKFLMSQGHTSKALESFKRIYASNSGNPVSHYPIKELQAPLKSEEEMVQQQSVNSTALSKSRKLGTVLQNGWSQISPIFRQPYLNVALLLFSIQICIMLCFNSIRLWTPQLFTTLTVATNSDSLQVAEATTICDLLKFVSHPSSSELSTQSQTCLPIKGGVYLRSLLIGVAATASFIVSIPLVGLIGKKNIARICLPLGAVTAIGMNWATNMDVFMALVAIYIGVLENGLSVLSSVAVESFPTAFRSMSISLLLMCGRIGSMCGNLLFPVLLNISCNTVFFSIGGVLLWVSLLLWVIPKRDVKH